MLLRLLADLQPQFPRPHSYSLNIHVFHTGSSSPLPCVCQSPAFYSNEQETLWGSPNTSQPPCSPPIWFPCWLLCPSLVQISQDKNTNQSLSACLQLPALPEEATSWFWTNHKSSLSLCFYIYNMELKRLLKCPQPRALLLRLNYTGWKHAPNTWPMATAAVLTFAWATQWTEHRCPNRLSSLNSQSHCSSFMMPDLSQWPTEHNYAPFFFCVHQPNITSKTHK